MENIIDNKYSNTTDFFTNPDRKCEQFLYQRGIRFIATIKGETGWTYWVYPRTDVLAQAINDYKVFLSHRRTIAKLWTGKKPATDSQVTV